MSKLAIVALQRHRSCLLKAILEDYEVSFRAIKWENQKKQTENPLQTT